MEETKGDPVSLIGQFYLAGAGKRDAGSGKQHRIGGKNDKYLL